MSSFVYWLLDKVNFATTSVEDPAAILTSQILDDSIKHPIANALKELIVEGGGGSWPPKATHAESWPNSLKPYQAAFNKIAPYLPVKESSLVDVENRVIIDKMRARIVAALEDVDSVAVRETLDNCERGVEGESSISTSGWLGFYACMAALRHAYRWGVLPVVREAQNEKSLEFPSKLNLPWPYIQRRLGITSPGGSLSSNSYFNLNARREIVYSITAGMGPVHNNTERWNSLIFVEIEDKALPLYHQIARASYYLENNDIPSTIAELEQANISLKATLKHFYDNMNDTNLVPAIWLPYCQGFQGWTLDDINGVSGGQNIIIRTLDSFLGIRPWPTDEEEALHLPLAQRNWLNCLRQFDIRAKAEEALDDEVVRHLNHMVSQLRLWRMGHMRRMQRYQVERPERRKMTAGKSLVQDDTVVDDSSMIDHLKDMLGERLTQTK